MIPVSTTSVTTATPNSSHKKPLHNSNTYRFVHGNNRVLQQQQQQKLILAVVLPVVVALLTLTVGSFVVPVVVVTTPVVSSLTVPTPPKISTTTERVYQKYCCYYHHRHNLPFRHRDSREFTTTQLHAVTYRTVWQYRTPMNSNVVSTKSIMSSSSSSVSASKLPSPSALLCSANHDNDTNNGALSSSTDSSLSYIQVISNTVSDALGRTVELEMTNFGGSNTGGGSGATTLVVQETTMTTPPPPPQQQRYFVKSTINTESNRRMLMGEYYSVLEIYNTQTIRVPKPIAYGEYNNNKLSRTFIVLEYLQFAAPSSSSTSQYELGQQLALLHYQSISSNPNPKESPYGFHVNNAIGATLQPNLPLCTNWIDFFIQYRLNHMLQLTNHVDMSKSDINALRQKVRFILQQHTLVQPSLVHGDLWGGNKGFCYDTPPPSTSTTSSTSSSRTTEINDDDDDDDTTGSRPDETTTPTTPTKTVVVPCIFDPAAYYGDREVDIAMTYLFGGYTNDFYRGYNDTFPLSNVPRKEEQGQQQRRKIYNLYHILNHDVLFGGGYRNQARNMIYEILQM